ncbi:3-dehydroquinate synthase [Clostridiaceae bacterium M8S5]|nr:3-dehydroquinate synthase [Clostridiaceae bacterium M8S5]
MSFYEINIDGNKYSYFLNYNLDNTVEQLLSTDLERYVIIYDGKLNIEVVKILRDRILNRKKKCNLVCKKVCEGLKTISNVDTLICELLEIGVDRSSCLVAIGGGVLGNFVGLTASLLFRGIKLVHIPTTTIAAADSVLSLKQAVNSKFGKNLIGTFYKPEIVITEFTFFSTLSTRDYKSGIVELVKNLLVIIPEEIESFIKLTKNGLLYNYEELELIIELSIRAKTKVLKKDMTERKDGLVLEYGHTVGHAVEFLSNGKFKHGECVAYGMLVNAEISSALGKISEDEVAMHYKLLEQIDVVKQIYKIKEYPINKIMQLIENDNKRGYIVNNELIPIVLLDKLGKSSQTNGYNLTFVSKEDIVNSICKVNKYLNKWGF